MTIIKEALSLSDVMLIPQYSDITSRSNVNVSVQMGQRTFDHPVIPANMKNIAGKDMCIEVIKSGGLAILHRFMDDKEQLQIATDLVQTFGSTHLAVSIGVKPEDKELVNRFYFAGVRIVCVDVAHGDSQACVEMVEWIKDHNPDMFVIAGNVSTGSGAQRLWEAGADVVKAGQGNGSLCSTRIETGNGIPQLTALIDVAETRRVLVAQEQNNQIGHNRRPSRKLRSFGIIADGGITAAGEIVKSLCFADMVMCGSLFAGCQECSSPHSIIDGVKHREYAGSSTHKNKHIEGIKALVPATGTYASVLEKLLEGLRSGCSYQGAHDLTELKDHPEFVRISHAGLIESHPHIKGIK